MPTVLVVEDDANLNRLFIKKLSGAGLACKSEYSVAGTCQLLQSGYPFDLVILDLELTDGSGLDVMDFMIAGAYEIPVVVVSVHARTLYHDIIQRKPAYILAKPVSPRELLQTVQTALLG